MNNRGILVGCTGFIVGLALGVGGTYVAMTHYAATRAAETLVGVEQLKLGEASERAHHAYRHENKPVAIYAMSQYVNQLKQAEALPEHSRLSSDRMLAFDLTLAHGRLAKLYAETGDTNLSAHYLAEALVYAKRSPAAGITNQEDLAELILRLDRQAVK